MPATVPVVGTDARWRQTTLPLASIARTTGLLIRDARRTDPPDPASWTDIDPIGQASRPGAAGAGFTVYRVTATNAALNAVALPARQPGAVDARR
jgi:hypothetical protein